MIKTRIARVVGSGLAVGLLVVGVTSCGKITEKASEKTAEKIAGDALGGDVDYDPDSGKVQIKNDDGTFSYGEGVPEDWPDDIPIPDGMEVQGSITTDTPEGKEHTLTGSTDKSVDEMADYYEEKMSDWTKKGGSTFESEGKMVSLDYTKGNREVSMSIVRNEGDTDTTVLYTYTENSGGSDSDS